MLTFTCPQCGKSLQVPEEKAGKQGRCKGCKFVFTAPIGNTPPPAPREAVKAARRWPWVAGSAVAAIVVTAAVLVPVLMNARTSEGSPREQEQPPAIVTAPPADLTLIPLEQLPDPPSPYIDKLAVGLPEDQSWDFPDLWERATARFPQNTEGQIYQATQRVLEARQYWPAINAYNAVSWLIEAARSDLSITYVEAEGEIVTGNREFSTTTDVAARGVVVEGIEAYSALEVAENVYLDLEAQYMAPIWAAEEARLAQQQAILGNQQAARGRGVQREQARGAMMAEQDARREAASQRSAQEHVARREAWQRQQGLR